MKTKFTNITSFLVLFSVVYVLSMSICYSQVSNIDAYQLSAVNEDLTAGFRFTSDGQTAVYRAINDLSGILNIYSVALTGDEESDH